MDTKKEHIFIVRCGEVALKGMNKPYFERMLVERIKKLLKKFDGISVKRQEGLIFVRADGALNKQEIIHEISKVFGVASISPAVECESTMESIGEAAVKYMLEAIEERGIKTFKVEAKRADKNFPVKSPEIGRQIGAVVLKGCKVLKVDVHHPDCLLFVDVRHDKSYIYQDKIAGFGGLPLGTNGKGLVPSVRRDRFSGRYLDDGQAGHDDRSDPFPFLPVHQPESAGKGGRSGFHRSDLLRTVQDARDQSVADPGTDRGKLSRRRNDDTGAPVHDADRTGNR